MQSTFLLRPQEQWLTLQSDRLGSYVSSVKENVQCLQMLVRLSVTSIDDQKVLGSAGT